MSQREIIIGDSREKLKEIKAESVQAIVTSPPYFAMRSYQGDGEDGVIGLEETIAGYISNLMAVLDECWRVLKSDGVLWLNLGDGYARAPSRGKKGTNSNAANSSKFDEKFTFGKGNQGLRDKTLFKTPDRVAIAMIEKGWILRSDIIWAKKNNIPEIVNDRPTSAHEHIFMFTKEPNYYYDLTAISEPRLTKINAKPSPGSKSVRPDGERNARNVWFIQFHPYHGSHAAPFPPEIPRRCILLSTKPGDMVLDPFSGAGTTVAVANALGRDGIGIELNPEYAELSRTRTISFEKESK